MLCRMLSEAAVEYGIHCIDREMKTEKTVRNLSKKSMHRQRGENCVFYCNCLYKCYKIYSVGIY